MSASTASQPVLSVRNLCKNFGALAVTQSVSLDLMRARALASSGPTGRARPPWSIC